MGEERLPKKMLFGELRKRRAYYGPKKRRREGLKVRGLTSHRHEGGLVSGVSGQAGVV